MSITKVEGIIHRFDPSVKNTYHWNGSTNTRTLSGKKVNLNFPDLDQVRRMLDEQ